MVDLKLSFYLRIRIDRLDILGAVNLSFFWPQYLLNKILQLKKMFSLRLEAKFMILIIWPQYLLNKFLYLAPAKIALLSFRLKEKSSWNISVVGYQTIWQKSSVYGSVQYKFKKFIQFWGTIQTMLMSPILIIHPTPMYCFGWYKIRNLNRVR